MMGMRRAPQHILNPTDLSSSNVTFDKKLSYLHKTNAVQWANEFRNLHISDPNLVRELLDAKMANVFGRTLLHEKSKNRFYLKTTLFERSFLNFLMLNFFFSS